MTSNYYRPQRSWGKVMFLHVSVILFTGGCLVPGGGCLLRGLPGPGGLCCPVPGACSAGGGVETPVMATAAGGTHPTGMHSCSNL